MMKHYQGLLCYNVFGYDAFLRMSDFTFLILIQNANHLPCKDQNVETLAADAKASWMYEIHICYLLYICFNI